METIKAIFSDINFDIYSLDPDNFYYEKYWQLVLNYPLIFLPDNRIVFYGFNIKLLKNEYSLLKSIITLNSNNNNRVFSEEEILEVINYKRVNTNVEKLHSYQRFIITTSSAIKRKIKQEIIFACLNCIQFYRYNPINGIYNFDKKIKLKSSSIEDQCKELKMRVKRLENDKKFINKLLNEKLNLVKILIPMQDYTDPFHSIYKSFIPKIALKNLISVLEGQKHNSEHRYYKTSFIFEKNMNIKYYERKPRHKQKKGVFNQAQYIPTRYNISNFVN